MNNTFRLTPSRRKQTIKLSTEEETQLNTIIDLLIPADKDFPPPSSLHLIDELKRHLLPTVEYRTTVLLNENHLRNILQELNSSAGGSFCQANTEKQQSLLRRLEQREPAFFQALWSIVNHSYYTLLANRFQSQVS